MRAFLIEGFSGVGSLTSRTYEANMFGITYQPEASPQHCLRRGRGFAWDGGCPLSSHPRPDSIRHTLLGAQSPVRNDPYRRGNRIQI